MMREGQRRDTIKLYVHLIGKLKRGEAISLGNRMLSTQFKNIANRQVKLMLEIESLHHDNRGQEQFALIIDAAAEMKEEAKGGSIQGQKYELLTLKAHSAALSRAIQEGKDGDISYHTRSLLQGMTSVQHFRFILQSMFRIRSLVALIRTDADRIRQKMGGEKELKRLLHVVAMVKATVNREQAVKIIKSINQNTDVLDNNKRLIAFIAEMVKKEKDLTLFKAEDDNFEPSINFDKISKTVLKNSIENECRIIINADNPAETFKRMDSSLEQQIYLHAFPLTHLFFQKNPEVIEGVRHTQLYKNLITSKSFIVADYGNNASLNSMKSRTKSMGKIKKNPGAHEEYLKVSHFASLNCVSVCRQGLLFNKHNFGNLQSSIKFVRVTGECLEYFKTRQASDSGSRWHFTEILCVTYGKATPRQVQNYQDFPQTCFSVVMKDRTLDLSVENKQRIQEMHSFIRGLTYLLGQYRLKEKDRYEAELQKLKESKQNKIRELNETIRFHEGKIQNLTSGGLLWSQLLLTINSRAGLINDARINKTEGIRRTASKVSVSKASNVP